MGIFALANTTLQGFSLILLLTIPAISFAQDEQMRSSGAKGGSARYFGLSVDQSQWVSYLTLCDDGELSHDQLLKSYGDDKGSVEKRLKKYFVKAGECLSSSDGSKEASTTSRLGFQLVVADPTLHRSGVGGVDIPSRLSNFARDYISGTKVAPSAAIEEVLRDCGDNSRSSCSGYQLLALLFAMSNSLSVEEKEVSAAQWRWAALRESDDEERRRRVTDGHRLSLVKHAKMLLTYAANSNDFGLAKMANGIIQKYEEDEEGASKAAEIIDNWRRDLSDERLPSGVEIPAVAENPFSDKHSAVLRYVSATEIAISVKDGSINFAQLQCVDTESDKYTTVQLQTQLRSGWTIPKPWTDCYLIILTSNGAKIKVWEYPEGTLDANGNPSI